MKAHNDQYWNFKSNLYFFHNLNKEYSFLQKISSTCNWMIALQNLFKELDEGNQDNEIFKKMFFKYFNLRLFDWFSYLKHFIKIFFTSSGQIEDIAKLWVCLPDDSYKQEEEIKKDINKKYDLLFISSKKSQLSIKNEITIQNYQYSLVSAISFPSKKLFFKDKGNWSQLNCSLNISKLEKFPPELQVSFLCFKYESEIKEKVPKKRANEEYSSEEKIRKRRPLGYFSKIGIPNIGNTCYLNSVLQILASTPGFSENLSLQTSLEISLNKLLNSIKYRSANSVERNAETFKTDLGQNFPMVIYMQFLGYGQNDAKELFVQIISFCNELNPQNHFFEVYIDQMFECHNTHLHKSYNCETELFMTVPPHYLNIKKYFDDKRLPKKYINQNQLYCQNCERLADTTLNVLEIKCHLNLAFYMPKRTSSLMSIRREFKEFREIELNNVSYCLYGIICYYGVSTYGHYIAYTINTEGEWEKYNDISVSYEDPDFDNAYMLFYKRN
ncbi:unnamed protein product [Blepharisma stoltei]|uniref:USP domain-containing protein n=1 Tax=Blepharisma stoltei TaxID=1481888 RepID=A0AAU9JDU5_9CILI|nr:unnamed protein product [Blepharisma stoltei]CAG9324176.1 unnamed protein product [Blepharisma stoltei]